MDCSTRACAFITANGELRGTASWAAGSRGMRGWAARCARVAEYARVPGGLGGGWVSVGPGVCGFELTGDGEEYIFSAVCGDELHADW